MFPTWRQAPESRNPLAGGAPAAPGLPLLAVAWMCEVLHEEFPTDAAAAPPPRDAVPGAGRRLRLDPLFAPARPRSDGRDGPPPLAAEPDITQD